MDKGNTPNKAPNGVDPTSLYTQENAEKGEWLDIEMPTITDKLSLKVLGADSFEYRAEIARSNASEVARKDLTDEEFRSDKEIKRRHICKCKSLAVLVTDWKGFNQPFSKEACENLLINAPLVAHQVDIFAGTRANFIKPR